MRSFWRRGDVPSTISRSLTIPRRSLGTSIPTVVLPGIGATMRTLGTARAMARSFDSPATFETRSPASSSISNWVMTGPVSIWTTRTWHPCSRRVFSRRRARDWIIASCSWTANGGAGSRMSSGGRRKDPSDGMPGTLVMAGVRFPEAGPWIVRWGRVAGPSGARPSAAREGGASSRTIEGAAYISVGKLSACGAEPKSGDRGARRDRIAARTSWTGQTINTSWQRARPTNPAAMRIRIIPTGPNWPERKALAIAPTYPPGPTGGEGRIIGS